MRGVCQGRQTIESPQIKFNDENGVRRARSGINDARGERGEGREKRKGLNSLSRTDRESNYSLILEEDLRC